jgi:hypothetical protein
MPGHLYNVPLKSAADYSFNGTQTLAQVITPATRRAWILELSLSGKSVTATDVPMLVYLARQSTAGTSSASVTPAPFNPDYPAALSTVNVDFTVEPTTGVLVRGPWYVSPVGGLYVLQNPLGLEVEIPQSGRLGLVVVTPQVTAMRGNLVLQE